MSKTGWALPSVAPKPKLPPSQTNYSNTESKCAEARNWSYPWMFQNKCKKQEMAGKVGDHPRMWPSGKGDHGRQAGGEGLRSRSRQHPARPPNPQLLAHLNTTEVPLQGICVRRGRAWPLCQEQNLLYPIDDYWLILLSYTLVTGNGSMGNFMKYT